MKERKGKERKGKDSRIAMLQPTANTLNHPEAVDEDGDLFLIQMNGIEVTAHNLSPDQKRFSFGKIKTSSCWIKKNVSKNFIN